MVVCLPRDDILRTRAEIDLSSHALDMFITCRYNRHVLVRSEDCRTEIVFVSFCNKIASDIRRCFSPSIKCVFLQSPETYVCGFCRACAGSLYLFHQTFITLYSVQFTYPLVHILPMALTSCYVVIKIPLGIIRLFVLPLCVFLFHVCF